MEGRGSGLLAFSQLRAHTRGIPGYRRIPVFQKSRDQLQEFEESGIP